MAATAELQTIQPEVYASSLRAVKGLGIVAAHEARPSFENGDVQEAWRDFITGAAENLATDAQYGERLQFEHFYPHDIIDGRVRAGTGEPVVDLVERGYKASLLLAEYDSKMAIQAERDYGDVLVAKEVDSLQIGELLAVVSMEPKEALKRDPAYWCGKGYREGMAVAQVYYRVSETEMLAGPYCIKNSDKAALSRVFAAHGAQILVDESENQWIRHGIRRHVTRDEAEEFGPGLVRAHQQELGDLRTRLSVTEMIRDNNSLAMNYFYDYLVPLSRAYVTKTSEPAVCELASAMLQNEAAYDSNARHSLMRLANGLAPDDADVRFMSDKIRYAFVEELRLQLPSYLAGEKKIEPEVRALRPGTGFGINMAALHARSMSNRMADNIAAGIVAKRNYGGCKPLGEEEFGIGENGADSQDIFGGKTKKKESDEDCEFISEQCPNCKAKKVKTTVTKTHISGSCGCKVKR